MIFCRFVRFVKWGLFVMQGQEHSQRKNGLGGNQLSNFFEVQGPRVIINLQ